MARSISFVVSDATVAVTGTTYTITSEKDWEFLLETIGNFRNDTYSDATVELTIYTDNTALTTKIATRLGDLD